MEFLWQGMALFRAGGPVMFLILLCSFAVVAIFVERFMYYNSMKALPQDFSGRLEALIRQEKIIQAVSLCRETDNAAAFVAAAGLECLSRAPQRLELVLESEAALCAARLRHNLGHLESIVTIAPLLGLLGTVFGMMESFKIMNLKSGEPLAITGGIGEALTATAFGLCVAIAAMAAYSYLTHRVNKAIDDIEELSALLIRGAK